MGEDEWPGVIEGFHVRTGANDFVAMFIEIRCTLSRVELAVIKRG